MIDQDLLTTVQYALVEIPNGGLGWASEMWTIDEVYGYLQVRQQRLLKATHLLVGVADLTITANVPAYDLPTDWIATVHAAWHPASNLVRELLSSDHVQADYGMSNWQATPGTPIAYTDVNVGTRRIQLIPTPDADGTVHLIYVPAATYPIGVGEPLQVPDTHDTPVLKYSIMADMLAKVGRGKDQQRADYCQWRDRLGEEVTRLLLNGRG